MRKPRTKSKRKPVVTKSALQAQIKELTDGLEWGKRIIKMQQAEVDRLMKLNDTLTGAISNMAKREAD
jgi:hypothetical protein